MNNLTAKEWGLYIGQNIIFDSKKGKLIGMLDNCLYVRMHEKQQGYNTYNALSCKVILRSLDQMTKKEKIEAAEMFNFPCNIDSTVFDDIDEYMDYFWDYAGKIKGTDWLTQKGFAIRNEFERGVAVKE